MFDLLTSPAAAGGFMCFAGLITIVVTLTVLYRAGRP